MARRKHRHNHRLRRAYSYRGIDNNQYGKKQEKRKVLLRLWMLQLPNEWLMPFFQ